MSTLSTPLLIVAWLALALSSACSKPDPNHCRDAPFANCLNLLCEDNGDCSDPEKAVCDTADTQTCVQCIADASCPATAPICDDKACVGCSSHGQCAVSSACLPDGSCANETDVAYVRAGATGTQCTQSAPCGALDDGLATSRPYVKIVTGPEAVADTGATIIDGKTVTILADPGAKLDRADNGAILDIRNGADVEIYDLEITEASGLGVGVGILMLTGSSSLSLTRVKLTNNLTKAIDANLCRLAVSRSTISGNIDGGISLRSCEFDITNTIIANNGGLQSSIGGIRFIDINMGVRRFEFNTVTSNNKNGGDAGAGVECPPGGQPITFSSNIVFDNQVASLGAQVIGNCLWTHSDIGPGADVSGTGNINMDPLFEDADTGNFHLTSTSPARDTADPQATLLDDVDGNVRPQGARRDMGADEVLAASAAQP